MADVQEGQGFLESVFNSQEHLSAVGRGGSQSFHVECGQEKAGRAAMAKAGRAPPARAANEVAGPLLSSEGAPHTVSVRVYYIRTDQVHT